MTSEEGLEERLAELRARLEELRRNAPAHSSSIHHMVQMEELEEEIELLERRLAG